MALTEQVELRAKFLREAAHLLAVPSPAAAAFLGTARHTLIRDTDLDIPLKEYESLCREVCSACGNIMVPGWSCKVSTRSQVGSNHSKRKGQAKSSANLESSTIYECLRCHRDTIQTLQPKPRRQMRKPTRRLEPASTLDASKTTKEVSDKVVKTVNASSKQRQKARKGGLQAMLEKNKSQSSNTSGFDLMDFAM